MHVRTEHRATSVGAVSREGGGASVLASVAACGAWPHLVGQKGVGGVVSEAEAEDTV